MQHQERTVFTVDSHSQNTLCRSQHRLRHSALRKAQCHQRRARRSTVTACNPDQTAITARLLDRFWQARGVADADQRHKLVAAATNAQHTTDAHGLAGTADALPSLVEYWGLDQSASPQVLETSHKLLQLQKLLGEQDDVDVVWMLIREPGLLNTDMSHLSSRLMTMKLAAGSTQVDVIKTVHKHPSLLLQKSFVLDQQESTSKRVEAWQHGLVSDGDLEWEKRCLQLAQHAQEHGDAHIGYRDGEDADLARWARKQRAAHRDSSLDPSRAEQMQKLGFELDDEAAEWLKSFNEVKAYQGLMGHSCPGPLTTGASFLLSNWCSVQRVAKRSGVLPAERIAMLNDIEFDWTCADALS